MSTDRADATLRDVVDDVLLAGADDAVRLWLGSRPVDLGTLRCQVDQRHRELADRGIGAGSSVALWLPPSLAYLTTLLAAWRAGAQVVLLDYRLTRHEVDQALARLRPWLLVSAASGAVGPLRGHHPVTTHVTAVADPLPPSWHALVQLSSGSTGPSKIIGRTADTLAAEIQRYQLISGTPGQGERIVVLSSLTHTFGLVGGLLHGLAVGAGVVLPDQLTSSGILAALAAGDEPTTVLGVPFHVELMAAVSDPPALSQLVRVVSGGELIRPGLPDAFVERYGVPLGQCYGMTEVGVIAMDPDGVHWPGVGRPAPGVDVRVDGAELLVSCATSPYIGQVDPSRWAGGWLRTRDAATIDQATAGVRLLGRLDSQVTVGGTTVDLSEVEHTLAGLSGVAEAIVVYDRGIEAYLALRSPTTAAYVEEALTGRLAPFKRPRRLHVVAQLPRTSTGKRVRDLDALLTAAGLAA